MDASMEKNSPTEEINGTILFRHEPVRSGGKFSIIHHDFMVPRRKVIIITDNSFLSNPLPLSSWISTELV
jgi:hypothetical protein